MLFSPICRRLLMYLVSDNSDQSHIQSSDWEYLHTEKNLSPGLSLEASEILAFTQPYHKTSVLAPI